MTSLNFVACYRTFTVFTMLSLVFMPMCSPTTSGLTPVHSAAADRCDAARFGQDCGVGEKSLLPR